MLDSKRSDHGQEQTDQPAPDRVETTDWRTEAETPSREITSYWLIGVPIAVMATIGYVFGRRSLLNGSGGADLGALLATDVPISGALAALGLMIGGVTFLDSKVNRASDVLNRDDSNDSQRLRALVEAARASTSAQYLAVAAVIISVITTISAVHQRESIFSVVAVLALAGWVTWIAGNCQPAARTFKDVAAERRRAFERKFYAEKRLSWPAEQHHWRLGLALQIVFAALGMTAIVSGVAAGGHTDLTPGATVFCFSTQVMVTLLSVSGAGMYSMGRESRQTVAGVVVTGYLYLAALLIWAVYLVGRRSPVDHNWQLLVDFGAQVALMTAAHIYLIKSRHAGRVRWWPLRPFLGMAVRNYLDSQHSRFSDAPKKRARKRGRR